jgi:hypothetical protein
MTTIDIEGVAKNLTVDWLRRAGARPRLHPNGFVQLNLLGEGGGGSPARLHVFPWPLLRPSEESNTPCHDHIFDMHSEVILGSVEQVEFAVALSHGASPTHEIWSVRTDGLNRDGAPGPTGVLVEAWLDQSSEFEAGCGYSQRAFTFHETRWYGMAATVMTKRRVYQDFSPRILVPVGIGHDPAQDDRSRVPEDTLWEVIDQALRSR